MAWFEASTPVLSQLGASIGKGLPSTSNSTQTASSPDYTEVFENIAREQRRNADREYSLKKRDLDQQYKIAKLNAKTARERNEIDRWYNEQQVRIAGERLAEDRRQFDLSHGLNQARLGYDVLNMAAQLRGPEDYFAASNFSRGVAAQPGTAAFLDALKNNTQLAAFGAQAGAPDAVSVNSLAAKLGGPSIMPGTAASATSGGGQDVDALHRQIQQIGLQGAHKLGPQSLEQLTDTEMKLLQSGLGTAGPDGKAFDVPTFLDVYRRSRVSQGLGNMRAA